MSAPPSDAGGSRRGAGLLAWTTGAAILAVALALQAGALSRRAGPPTDDEARHLVLAGAVGDLSRQPPGQWLDGLYAAGGAQPPVHHVVTALGFRVLGESAQAAWAVQLALLAAAALLTWRFAQVRLGLAAGALAAVIFATLPGVTRVARTARPEMTGAVLVALALALLAVRRPGKAATAGLGLVLGLGTLTLWSFPLFVAGPLLVASTTPAAPGGWTRRRLAAAAVLALLVASPWWVDFALHRIPTQGILVALAAAPPGPRLPHAAFFWASTVVDRDLSAPLRLVLLPTLLVTAWRLRPGPPEQADQRGAAGALALGVGLPWAVLAGIGAVDQESLLPALPMLAALLAWTVTALASAWARDTAAAALAAYAVAALFLALGDAERTARARHALRRLPLLYTALTTDAGEMGPRPDLLAWPAEALVDQIVAGVSPRAPRAAILLVPNHATLNPMTLTWLARRRGLRLAASPLPEEGPPPRAAVLDYVLVNVKGDQGPDHVTRRQARATRTLLRRRGLVAVADLPSPVGPLSLLRSQAALSPPVPMPPGTSFDLTRSAVRWHLVHGWSEPEAYGTWALGPRAGFRMRLARATPHRLVAELAPYDRLGRAQVIEVRYGSTLIAVWRPPDHQWSTFTAEVPAELPTGSVDEVRFGFAAAARPMDRDLSEDPRRLAAFFRSIRFERVNPKASRFAPRGMSIQRLVSE